MTSVALPRGAALTSARALPFFRNLASGLGLKIDEDMTVLDFCVEKTRLLVTFDSADAMAMSAFQIQAVPLLALIAEKEEGDVEVVPFASSRPQAPHNRRSPCVTDWLREQIDCVNDWAKEASLTLLKTAMSRVMQSFPWRDIEGMKARYWIIVQDSVSALDKGERLAIFDGNVDALLPRLPSFFAPEETRSAVLEMSKKEGRVISTLLDLYQAIYVAVKGRGIPSGVVGKAYSALFAS